MITLTILELVCLITGCVTLGAVAAITATNFDDDDIGILSGLFCIACGAVFFITLIATSTIYLSTP